MLFRFCLYGLLKNQRYFEYFLILAFREKGLSYADIGLLIAFREVCANILEVPSGAIADLWGRRICLVFAFLSYASAFAVFGLANSSLVFYPAMLLFAFGEAFRSGTHKALIFEWLRQNNRTKEKQKIRK